MGGPGMWRRCNGGIQCFFELSPVCKACEGILEGQFTGMLLGCNTPVVLFFLLSMTPRREDQQSDAKYPSDAQCLVQLDRLLLTGDGALVLINVEFECHKRGDNYDGENQR